MSTFLYNRLVIHHGALDFPRLTHNTHHSLVTADAPLIGQVDWGMSLPLRLSFVHAIEHPTICSVFGLSKSRVSTIAPLLIMSI